MEFKSLIELNNEYKKFSNNLLFENDTKKLKFLINHISSINDKLDNIVLDIKNISYNLNETPTTTTTSDNYLFNDYKKLLKILILYEYFT